MAKTKRVRNPKNFNQCSKTCGSDPIRMYLLIVKQWDTEKFAHKAKLGNAVYIAVFKNKCFWIAMEMRVQELPWSLYNLQHVLLNIVIYAWTFFCYCATFLPWLLYSASFCQCRQKSIQIFAHTWIRKQMVSNYHFIL